MTLLYTPIRKRRTVPADRTPAYANVLLSLGIVMMLVQLVVMR